MSDVYVQEDYDHMNGPPSSRAGLQIPYQEIEYRDGGSPVESFDWETGGKATRVLLIDWDKRDKAVWQVLGKATHRPRSERRILRHLPEIHPTFPSMVATKLKIKGQGKTTPGWTLKNGKKINSYKYAILTIEYETPDYRVCDDSERQTELDRYVSVEFRPNGDYLSLPTGAMRWGEGPDQNKPFPGQIGKIITTMDLVWTWWHVPYTAFQFDAVLNLLGRVNHEDFGPTGGNPWPKHTLLLTAIDIVRVRSPYGPWAWKIKYTIKYNRNTHNKLLHFKSGAKNFYHVSVDGVSYPVPPATATPDGKLLFDEGEFKDLFRGPEIVAT